MNTDVLNFMLQIDARVTKNPQLPVELLVSPENKQLLRRIFSILGIKVTVNNPNVQRYSLIHFELTVILFELACRNIRFYI